MCGAGRQGISLLWVVGNLSSLGVSGTCWQHAGKHESTHRTRHAKHMHKQATYCCTEWATMCSNC
jgi:hypothetical protein